MLPLGEYDENKLLNLGQNRFIIRPQVGVAHYRGPWTFELSSSVFLFTENDDFFGGNERQQDPVYALQGHVIHTFSNQWWVSASAGYSWGGQSRINGQPKDDARSDLLAAISFGLPISESMGLKFAYVHGAARKLVGADTDSLLVSWTVRF